MVLVALIVVIDLKLLSSDETLVQIWVLNGERWGHSGGSCSVILISSLVSNAWSDRVQLGDPFMCSARRSCVTPLYCYLGVSTQGQDLRHSVVTPAVGQIDGQELLPPLLFKWKCPPGLEQDWVVVAAGQFLSPGLAQSQCNPPNMVKVLGLIPDYKNNN